MAENRAFSKNILRIFEYFNIYQGLSDQNEIDSTECLYYSFYKNKTSSEKYYGISKYFLKAFIKENS